LSDRLGRLAARRERGDLDDALYAAGYFLVWQTALHGRRFASRKSKAARRPDFGAWLAELDAGSGDALGTRFIAWFGDYHFLAVIPAVPEALVAWLRKEWPLRLMLRVPSPLEVLRMQAAGLRPVTVLADYSRACRPILGKANGFAFMIHDLEHGYKFFHDPGLHAAQRRFFGLLLHAVEEGRFEPYRSDPVFAAQLDYLLSDMNTHPVHGLRYLSAVLIECLLRRENKGPKAALSTGGEAELAAWLDSLGSSWDLSHAARAALTRLSGKGLAEVDAALLAEAVARSGASDMSSRTPPAWEYGRK
jgi:hypothetical protein